jgi:hypothetical protein
MGTNTSIRPLTREPISINGRASSMIARKLIDRSLISLYHLGVIPWKKRRMAQVRKQYSSPKDTISEVLGGMRVDAGL